MNALVVAAIWIVVLMLVALVVQWRGHRRPMSRDWCAVCHKDLRVGDVYEVHVGFDDAAEAEVAGFGGGSAMVATYCRRHAPKGARRSKA